MQSQGSTSSQPSFYSLSSSDSYLFSDSEQAEDDTDVFLSDRSPSVILSTGDVVKGDRSAGAESPGSQWACDSFTEVTRGHPRVTAERERTREMEDVQVKGDLLFAQKCAELQGFVRPLLELLNGLKGGRFDRGLSSFQQSVAIDRIQRIVGILRRPSIGEKYMNTLLQVEMMLKMWFPQVSPLAPQPAKPTGPAATTSTRDTPKCPHLHKHTDQSHIPVKKRRLSWSDTDSVTPPPVLLKRLNTGVGQERRNEGLDTPSMASGESLGPLDPASDQENDRKKDENSKDGESSSQKMAGAVQPCRTAQSPLPHPSATSSKASSSQSVAKASLLLEKRG
ncbi:circadian-associated transcriptional repressor isoform X2 [Esox lucius]|uniref:circadian-associated transcriptional repressor isoform X2 n=1 Tax=Esox lucius TaxID=8010 RepID=UPI0014776AA0|nr:circadian-associated transcriptional repressor isoform X2 [Esox lucius]